MTWLKQNWIKLGLGILILGALCFVIRQRTSAPSPLELHNKAYELMQAKDYSGALQNAQAAIKIDPNYVDAYVDEGMALYSMGNCPEGAAALYHASMLSPTDDGISEMLGSILNKCKEAEE
jgi:hypothetical protein